MHYFSKILFESTATCYLALSQIKTILSKFYYFLSSCIISIINKLNNSAVEDPWINYNAIILSFVIAAFNVIFLDFGYFIDESLYPFFPHPYR